MNPALQRYLTKKYDVLEIAGIEKLVRKGTGVIYYCTIEELYRLIKTAHSGIGHGWIHKTYKELKKQFPQQRGDDICSKFTTNVTL
jgi:hypothetical protein